jgi:hypothetical protein
MESLLQIFEEKEGKEGREEEVRKERGASQV